MRKQRPTEHEVLDPTDTTTVNQRRAYQAERAVETYWLGSVSQSSKYCQEPLQTVLCDLLSDLRHYCEQRGLDYEAATKMSACHFEDERTEEAQAVVVRKKYDHAFHIAFSLVNHNPDGCDSAQEIREAIRRRLRDLPDEELLEAVGGPFDSFEVTDE